MKRVTGIFEGEKLDLEKIPGKDNKLNIILYILSGHDSIKMSVRDNNLCSSLEAIPNREPIKFKAEVQTYKDELYLQALALLKAAYGDMDFFHELIKEGSHRLSKNIC